MSDPSLTVKNKHEYQDGVAEFGDTQNGDIQTSGGQTDRHQTHRVMFRVAPQLKIIRVLAFHDSFLQLLGGK